jgi:hypothetical protein
MAGITGNWCIKAISISCKELFHWKPNKYIIMQKTAGGRVFCAATFF